MPPAVSDSTSFLAVNSHFVDRSSLLTNMPSIASAASCCIGGDTWPYSPRVMAMSECPSISLTTLGLMRCAKTSVAAVWGYRPPRSLVAYLALVGGFAAAFYILGDLRWYEALVVSLTAFHKYGFFSQQYAPGDPQPFLAAVEAVFGLLIEIRFIATFT